VPRADRDAAVSGTIVRCPRTGKVKSTADHSRSQSWSRYVREHPEIYDELDGLLYPSAHNGEPAVALYERGRAGIEVPPGRDAPATDPAVLAAVRRVALDHGLVVLPQA
jgi:RES domain